MTQMQIWHAVARGEMTPEEGARRLEYMRLGGPAWWVIVKACLRGFWHGFCHPFG